MRKLLFLFLFLTSTLLAEDPTCSHTLGRTYNDFIPTLKMQWCPAPVGWDCCAYSLIGEVGNKNYRANGTFGIDLGNCGLGKVSAEFLRQRTKYNFSSGQTHHWRDQYAVGGGWSKRLNAFSFIRSIDFSGYWSSCPSHKMDPFTCDSGVTLIRKIAGSTASEGVVGLSGCLWHTSYYQVRAIYDRVIYHRTQQPRLLVDGFGPGVTFYQELPWNFELEVEAEFRRPFTYYSGLLNWHEPCCLKGMLIGLFATHTQGKKGLPNSTCAGIQISYIFRGEGFGAEICGWQFGCGNDCRSYAYDPTLTNYVIKPAVYVPAIQAIANQSSF